MDDRIARLVALLEASAASEYIGEAVSQLEHALQAAALAREAGAGECEVLAALLHDVGHLCGGSEAARMGELGTRDHEALGASFLEALGFGPDVTELVRGHVAAKRYLVATRPEYAARLSEASRGTLDHQGGPMDAAECAAFAADPRHPAKLRLRAWDEAAKVPGRRVAGLDAYRPLLEGAFAREPGRAERRR